MQPLHTVVCRRLGRDAHQLGIAKGNAAVRGPDKKRTAGRFDKGARTNGPDLGIFQCFYIGEFRLRILKGDPQRIPDFALLVLLAHGSAGAGFGFIEIDLGLRLVVGLIVAADGFGQRVNKGLKSVCTFSLHTIRESSRSKKSIPGSRIRH